MNKPSLANRFKLCNGIKKFRDFQQDVFDKLNEYNKLCIIASSGNGKTTIMKYLAFDFLDKNKNNKIIIFLNTNILCFNVANSMISCLDDDDEKAFICNLANYDKNNQITFDIIKNARIYISTPGKYLHLYKKIGFNFKLVCVDEIDILLDYNNDITSDILNIFEMISFEYSFVSTSTINDSVYTQFLHKYDFATKILNDEGKLFEEIKSKVKCYKIRFQRKERDWYKIICDQIYFILHSKQSCKKSIVFCNYKLDCDQLFNEYSATSKEKYCLHGNISVIDQNTILENYKEYGYILFTTDISHRGLNIEDIENVFHIGVTSKQIFYHRNGRSLRKPDSNPVSFLFYDELAADNPLIQDFDEYNFNTRL